MNRFLGLIGLAIFTIFTILRTNNILNDYSSGYLSDVGHPQKAVPGVGLGVGDDEALQEEDYNDNEDEEEMATSSATTITTTTSSSAAPAVTPATKNAEEENQEEKQEEVEKQDLIGGDKKNDSKPSESSTSPLICPPNTIAVEDIIIDKSKQEQQQEQQQQKIPTIVHILLETRCVSQKIHTILMEKGKSKKYSLLFHDRNDINELLLRHENSDNLDSTTGTSNSHGIIFPQFTKDTIDCIISIEHKIDLLKLLLLWDYGGIVADWDYLLYGGDEFVTTHIEEQTEAFVFQHSSPEEGSVAPLPFQETFNFMGSVPSHPALYAMIQTSISQLFVQWMDVDDNPLYPEKELIWIPMSERRRNIIIQKPIELFFPNSIVKTPGPFTDDLIKMGSHVGIHNRSIIVFDANDVFFLHRNNNNNNKTIDHPHQNETDLHNSNQTSNERDDLVDVDFVELKNLLSLKEDDETKKTDALKSCADFSPSRNELNINEIREIAGSIENYTCPDHLELMEDIYSTEQEAGKDRKIPKVIHLTSKTRCFNEAFKKGAEQWFFDDYSVVFHDDEAISRLMHQNWPAFPHLHDARKCITSGAGLSDMWRYLVLWKFGGLYTDIDNTPGTGLLNGTAIEDDMDAFLEVGRGGRPSQYFMASSPRHPIFFLAVQLAMSRLFATENIVEQFVPNVTGPGALKTAVLFTVGDGYPPEGTHVGIENRTLTMVNEKNKTEPYVGPYVFRGIIENKHQKSMNLTHYASTASTSNRPRKSCLEVLYDEYLQKALR